MIKESIPQPETQETTDPTQTLPTDTAALEAYYFFLDKISEVDEKAQKTFRQKLPESERQIFDDFSTDTRIKIVAYYLMPTYIAKRMSDLPAHLPIIHHVRNMLSAIYIFDSFWN